MGPAVGSWPSQCAPSGPPIHFLLNKIGRALVYSIYHELSQKITSQGVRGPEEGFYVGGRGNGWEVSWVVAQWAGLILG